jgi:pimeloyl-ACP methyl ester carboxylesterase
VPGLGGQVRSLPANALLRAKAEPGYADGDDATWTTVDWPALTRSVLALGRRINVIDTGGSGPPLLLLHGLGGVWQNWLLTIPAFRDAFRVIAPDLPGFGHSEMPAGRISIQGYARVIDALCSELGLEDVALVGNSMGGFIGAELALAFPTRVTRLVLVSAAGLSELGFWREPVMNVARVFGAVSAKTPLRSLPMVTRPRLRRAALQIVVRYPERLSVPLAAELVAGAGTHGFVGGLDAVLGYDYRHRLAEIEVPVLIVWGRNDILIPSDDAAEYERLIGANAEAVVFEDTGHLPMIERPSRFNALLAGFLAGEPSPQSDIAGLSDR